MQIYLLFVNNSMKKYNPYLLSIFALFSFFISKPAKAVIITVPLNYTVEATDNQNLSLSGQLVIDTDVAGAANRSTKFGERPSPVAIPAWITSVTLNYVDSGDNSNNFTVNKSDFAGMSWAPKTANVGSVDFDQDLVPQFDDIAFYTLGGSITSTATFNMDTGEDEFTLTSTPGPLGIFGILPFLSYSRKLKKAIEQSKCYRT